MKYRYVNLGFSDRTGNGRFRRDYTVPLEDVDKLRHLAGNECFYRTVWRYPSKDYERHAENGEALAPLYFDIDNKDTEKAREETLELVDYFLDTLPERYLYLYYSGNKGFHLEIPPEVFNLGEKLPDTKSAYAYKNYAKKLKEEHAPDIDLAVYEPKRLWRIVNSKNENSGLYKVPVTISEMEVLSGEEDKRAGGEAEEEHLLQKAEGEAHTGDGGNLRLLPGAKPKRLHSQGQQEQQIRKS